MANLIARCSILYQNRVYEGGESLPATDKAMVEAWVSAGSAKWIDAEEKQEKVEELSPVTISEPIGRKRRKVE